MEKHTKWYLIIIVTFIIWGTQHPALKILSGKMSPILFNLLRYSFAGLTLFPFVLRNKIKIDRGDLTKIAALGFIGIFLFGILNIVGVRLSTATNNAILLNSWPLLLVFIAPVLIDEKITKKAMIGTVLGFIGVIAVVTNGNNIIGLIQSEFFRGNLLIVLSGLCLAIYSTLSKKYIEKYGGLAVTFFAIAAGSILLLALSIASGEISGLSHISLSSLLLVLWIALPTTALTYVVWFKSIDKIGLVKTSSFFFLIPISGILTSNIFLKEPITIFTVIGTLLILAGVYIVQRKD